MNQTETTDTIRPLTAADARNVANLHIEGIPTGFISSLGAGFVGGLYEAVAQSSLGFGFVAETAGQAEGFIAFATDLNRLYRSIVVKRGLSFGFVLARRLLSLRVLKKVFETLCYPSKAGKMDLPRAELLSIVVVARARGKGLGAALISRGLAECAKRGIRRVKVLIGQANEPGNRLYQKCGFTRVAQITSHGVPSNIYVAEITPA